MSKYKLAELLSEVKGGRIGTLNITAMDLERKMEELEDEGITINRFYDSPDGKTYVEYHVHPEGEYNPDESFSVYDFKFGENPTDIDNEDKEYPFSIGGRGSALSSAKALLGSGQVAYGLDENEAVDLAIEASQEKAGIEVDESFDSLAKKLDKQKGITKDEADKIAGKIANIKRKGGGKGPTAKQKKRMSENNLNEMDVDLDQELRSRLSACLTKIKNHEERTGEMFYQEIAFDIENIIERLDDIQDVISNEPQINENSLPDGLVRALKVDGNGTKMEIEMYMKSLKQSGDKFDEVDDYVEDFKNYVADKSLQEHFGRFMKDYQ